jgi:predicted ATP-dependent endonuclease of OLD family
MITKIEVKNFKSIINESFELKDYTTIVGCNNVGKSNLMSAICWLIKRRGLGSEYFNDSNAPIEVTGEISGITPELLAEINVRHATAITPYIVNGRLLIRRTQRIPNETASNLVIQVGEYDAATGDTTWKANPAGIDAGLSYLFPDPVMINAMEDAYEDVSKFKTSTTIGKLLGLIFKTIEDNHGDALRTALTQFQSMLSTSGGERLQELCDFDAGASRIVNDFFPGISLKADIPAIEIKEVMKSGSILVYEGEHTEGRDASSMGHGVQRSIQVSLIRYLAETTSGDINTGRRTLLFIDEPELFLHPQAIEIVRDSLKLLSGRGYQVVVSTHSPVMITKDDIEHTIMLKKEPGRGTVKRLTMYNAIRRIEQDAASQLRYVFELSNSSYTLFSDKIILVEGETEEFVLPQVVKAIKGKTLGLFKTALIRLRGCGDIKKTQEIFSTMDIPCKALADIDVMFSKCNEMGIVDTSNVDYNACIAIMNRIASDPINRICLNNDGWPKKGNGFIRPEAAFELMAQDPEAITHISNLHELYKAHNIWVWKEGSIEKYLGLNAKSIHVWSGFCDRLESDLYHNVIAEHSKVLECINWLLD